jgi:hypothetical protein
MKINEAASLTRSVPPFIVPKYDINSDSYRYFVDFKLFELEVFQPSIN